MIVLKKASIWRRCTEHVSGFHVFVESLHAEVLEQVDSTPRQAQCLRALAVGVCVAARHLPSGTSSERGLAVHVHCVRLRSHRLLRGLDVHHQLHSQLLGGFDLGLC